MHHCRSAKHEIKTAEWTTFIPNDSILTEAEYNQRNGHGLETASERVHRRARLASDARRWVQYVSLQSERPKRGLH